jgi:hypothetical protein
MATAPTGRCGSRSGPAYGCVNQPWHVELASRYPAAMRSKLGAAIDRRLAELIIIKLCRERPLLKLMPTSWVCRARRSSDA